MEEQQAETVEETAVETSEQELSTADQEQIAEWLEDRLPQEDIEEVEEVEEVAAAAEETEEVEEAQEEVKETPRISKAFSKVAKKERELQQQRHQFNKEKEKLKPILEAQERVNKGDMIGALESINWTYEDATNMVLQDGKMQPPQGKAAMTPEVEARLAKLETMERQKQVDNYVNKLKTKVNADDRFELVRDNWDNAWPTILEMQKIVAQETGTVEQDEEILQKVEDFYEQQARQFASSGKLKKLFQPEAGLPEKTSDSPRIKKKTLRNKVTASQPTDKGEPKTRRERLEAALATYGSSL
jgi:predicted 3-demethylubiquinone-9 3-methyltransferase (glyoxalase superfamily)